MMVPSAILPPFLLLCLHDFSNGFVIPQKNSNHHTSILHETTAAANDVEQKTIAPIVSLDGTVTLPGSKSLSNRCLLLAALSKGNTRVQNLLDSDDIRYMLEALQQLGVPMDVHSSDSVTVHGQAGPLTQSTDETLFLGNAGTAMRPLAAALALGNAETKGTFVLDGVTRMRERPIADLVDGLHQLGATVSCGSNGCPPVTIEAPQQDDEGSKTTAAISGKMSSQFLSALLMAAPLAAAHHQLSLIHI